MSGKKSREFCDLGHSIEVRIYGGHPTRRCWTCSKTYHRERARTDQAKVKARMYYLRMYGLDAEAYKALLEAQDGRCAICRHVSDKTQSSP